MDRYRVDKVVGKGSYGQAILCARIADGKACIVKQVDTSKLPSKARREANKEATLLAKLNHPNIVGFWESFFHGPSRDVLCIVMDYADGGDLSCFLRRRNGRLINEEIVLDWFVQTTLALKHIHDRKILHRDLKTQNIFLTQSRVVKLGDFGIAKILGSTVDLAKTAIGTPYYMSPEICQEKRYNHKSDMWALGCVLYEMTCLRHAFEGNNMRLLVMKICTQDPRPISARYSSGVRSLVAQLLKKDPHARPSTGAVLRRPLIREKIGRFLSDTQIKEEFSNGVSPGHQRRSRSSAAWAAAAAPRWASNAGGISRGVGVGSRDNINDGQAVADGGRSEVAQAAAAEKQTERSEQEANDQRRAEILARQEARAVAKGRGQLAAVALNIAKPSSAERRLAKPNRPNSAEDAAGKQKREAKQVKDRAEVAQVALGIGGRRPPPRRASPHDGDSKAQARRRPSTRAASPAGVGSNVCGTGEGQVFQRVQHMRGSGSPPAGFGAEGAVKPTRLDAEGQREGRAGSGQMRSDEAVNDGLKEMGAALELARRRRAARAVFGPGFWGEDEEEPGGQQRVEVDKQGLEVKSNNRSSDRDRSLRPDEKDDERPAIAKPPRKSSSETMEVLPQPELKEAANSLPRRHDCIDNRGPVPDGDMDDTGRREEMGQPEAAGETDADRRRQLKQVQQETGAETVTDTSPPQAEQKGPRFDDGAPAERLAGGGVEGWVDVTAAPEKERNTGGLCREEADMDGRGQVQKRVTRDHEGSPCSHVQLEGKAGAGGGRGDGEVRGKVDLGVDDGWFQHFEARMGAIQNQVRQIKSPPTSTSRRGGDRNYRAGRGRNPVAATDRDDQTPPPRESRRRGGDENLHSSIGDTKPPLAEEEEGEKKAWREEGKRQSAEESDGAICSGEDGPSAAGAIGTAAAGRAVGSRIAALRRCNSQQAAGLLVAAAAAAVPAIPPNASEDNQTPGVRRCRSDGELLGHHTPLSPRAFDDANPDDQAGKPIEGTGGGGSGLARARSLLLVGAGGVKVVMTPAQKGSGGRAARKPPLSNRSERRAPRHAAALATELERHSENRQQRKARHGLRRPGGDDDEERRVQNIHTPTTEERVQALRAFRDCERGKLRALIASKRRKSSSENVKAEVGGGETPEGEPHGGPQQDEPLLEQELTSPRVREAAGGRRLADGSTGPPVSDPPPRREGRFRGTSVPTAVVQGEKGGAGGGSVDSSRRRRGPTDSKSDSVQDGASEAGAAWQGASGSKREPANRHQSLRDFIAESRQNRRAKRSRGLDGDNNDDDFSVLVPSRAGSRCKEELMGHDEPAAVLVEKEVVGFDEDDDVVSVVPRRNIGAEFDEEGRVWEVEEGVEAGGGEGCADEGGSTERGEERGRCEEKKGEWSSSRCWNMGQAGGSEAVSAMEGVHPGLATYESQRSAGAAAGGMDGGGRSGQEEYARMLELMKQEVLELGDDASTDSGWGGSGSSSGEGNSSEQEQRRQRGGDGGSERLSCSEEGGAHGAGGGGDASHVVLAPELAVFLFQGGVGSGPEARDENKSSSPPDDGYSSALGPAFKGCAGDNTTEGLRSTTRKGDSPSLADGTPHGEKPRGEKYGESSGKMLLAANGACLRVSNGDQDHATQSSSGSGELRGVDFLLSEPATRGVLP